MGTIYSNGGKRAYPDIPLYVYEDHCTPRENVDGLLTCIKNAGKRPYQVLVAFDTDQVLITTHREPYHNMLKVLTDEFDINVQFNKRDGFNSVYLTLTRAQKKEEHILNKNKKKK
jgi:hypothetical protein